MSVVFFLNPDSKKELLFYMRDKTRNPGTVQKITKKILHLAIENNYYMKMLHSLCA